MVMPASPPKKKAAPTKKAPSKAAKGNESESLRLLAERDDLSPFNEHAFALLALESRFGLTDVVSLAPTILTDGEADKKCDLLFVGRDHRTAVICQAYWATRVKENPPANKAADLHTASSWVLDPTDASELGLELTAAREELMDALANGEIDDIELWYCHNLSSSAQVLKELAQAAQAAKSILGRNHEYQDINVRGVEVNPAVVDEWLGRNESRVIIHDRILVPTDGWLQETGENWKGVYTSVSGSWLRGLYVKYTADRLFAGNVRGDMKPRRSKNDINNGIQTTAKNSPQRFWAYNNGVTALVEKIEVRNEKLYIRGITIVNGAQTTGSLGRLAADDVDLDQCRILMRFVEAGDPSVVGDISTFNNTQNEILPSDFRSSDQVQARLVQEFTASGAAIYWGPRRGGAEQGARKPKGLLDSDLVAQALAAFHGEPDTAYHDKKKIWLDNLIYGRIFSDKTHAAHVVFCVGLVKAVRAYKLELRAAQTRTTMQNKVFEYLTHRGSDFLLVGAIAQCIEEIVGHAVTDRWTLSFGDQVSVDVSAEHWGPAVRSLANYVDLLQPAARSGDLRDRDKVVRATSDFHSRVAASREGVAALDTFASLVIS